MNRFNLRSGVQMAAMLSLSVALAAPATAGTVRGVKPPVNVPVPPAAAVQVITPATTISAPPVIVDPSVSCNQAGNTSVSRC